MKIKKIAASVDIILRFESRFINEMVAIDEKNFGISLFDPLIQNITCWKQCIVILAEKVNRFLNSKFGYQLKTGQNFGEARLNSLLAGWNQREGKFSHLKLIPKKR